MAQLVRGKAGLIEALEEQKNNQEQRLRTAKLTKQAKLLLENEIYTYRFIMSWLEGITLLSEEEYDRGFKKWLNEDASSVQSD